MNYKNHKYFSLNKHFHLTKKGLDGLRDHLDQLRKEQIKISRRLMKMDIKEREEFIASTDAISHLDSIEQQIITTTEVLLRADIIHTKKNQKRVGLGSTVFLESDFEKTNYTLVNSIEANPSAHKISEDSPLGKALLGKKKHSIIDISSPRGRKYSYRVLAVK